MLLRGKKALYVRSSVDNTRLLVIMSTHNQGSNYLALRTFLENQFCDLLFISDSNNSWSASLIFSSVQNNHHDAIFVRINFGADKKDENVLVRNIKIVFGYFPDDLMF